MNDEKKPRKPKVVQYRTLSTYDPRLLDLLIRCSTRDEFKLPCSSNKEALNLKFRLYQVRKQMRVESHPSAEAVQHLSMKVAPGSRILTIFKNDNDVAATLDEAFKILDLSSEDSGAPSLDSLIPADYTPQVTLPDVVTDPFGEDPDSLPEVEKILPEVEEKT